MRSRAEGDRQRIVLALPRDELLRCLRAIGDPLRLRILVLLADPPGPRSGPFADGEPGMCVSDVRSRLGRAHALVSHHVQVLHRAGLIRRTRRGRWSLLQVETARVAALGELISALGGSPLGDPMPLHFVAPAHATVPSARPPGSCLGAEASGAPSW